MQYAVELNQIDFFDREDSIDAKPEHEECSIDWIYSSRSSINATEYYHHHPLDSHQHLKEKGKDAMTENVGQRPAVSN